MEETISKRPHGTRFPTSCRWLDIIILKNLLTTSTTNSFIIRFPIFVSRFEENGIFMLGVVFYSVNFRRSK